MWMGVRSMSVRLNHARYVTFGGSGGMKTMADWNCLTQRLFPRPRFGMNLLGGESNVTARGCMNISAGELAFQRRGLVSWELYEAKQCLALLVSG